MKRKYVAARWGELTIRSWELKDYIGYRKMLLFSVVL